MSEAGRQLGNPFSTGGGGAHFEAHIQASFVLLLLTGGFAPCLPGWPIKKIKLQTKFDGYDTDDMVVFVQNREGLQERKILCQIRRSVSITESNESFSDVIQAAWNDFQNTKVFNKGEDRIALITGPLSATDISDARDILEQARNSESSDEYFQKIQLAKYESDAKRNKLSVFNALLKKANGNVDVPRELVFEFLRHFHLLGYDLDVEAGVTLSLLHSLIGQYSIDNARALWAQLVDLVQTVNKNAGTITRETLPAELQEAFTRGYYETIPAEFSASQLPTAEVDWSKLKYARDLAIANLLGEWNENADADVAIVEKLTGERYSDWILKIREILQLPESPIELRNSIWSIHDRNELWKELGSRIFDENLEVFKQCAITVLTEPDPQFELPSEDRITATIKGKVLAHSDCLRRGLAGTVALLGTDPGALTYCSQNKSIAVASLSIREILDNANWVLWASLNNLLPLLAEAAPGEFMSAVETALHSTSCPIDELFVQEDTGIFGHNYLTGLLWALETLAWDENIFVRVIVILSELASRDPGGSSGNRPAHSLTTILLPWFPQTTASIEKREVAVKTVEKEAPDVAWDLLLSLLPNRHQISTGSHKPVWRHTLLEDFTEGVTEADYWRQVTTYADQAVEIAKNDLGKMKILISDLSSLPKQAFDKVMEHLSSEDITSRPESERLGIWIGLTEFTAKHTRFSDSEWALAPDIVLEIIRVAEAIAPKNPLNLYRRLFSDRDYDLYEEIGDWEAQQKHLQERRKQAIEEIVAYGGLEELTRFAESVESPYRVGLCLGLIAEDVLEPADAAILPDLLETSNSKLAQLAYGYVWGRHRTQGWTWVDNIDTSEWSPSQIGTFLTCLPFDTQTWNRVASLLGDLEATYWGKVVVNPFQTDCDLRDAIEKLIEYGRPRAAIECLYRTIHDKQQLDNAQSVKALLTAVSSKEPLNSMGPHHVIAVIKALQDDPHTDPNGLFQVEWSYLPLLNRLDDALPKLLETKLSAEPEFFCEVIQLMYRSKNEAISERETSEEEKTIAENAWRLLHGWQTPPGLQPDGRFSGGHLKQWLEDTKRICSESGHLEVALTHVGNVLFYCPADSGGLWIDHAAAEALNANDAEKMRGGFYLEVINSRGAHWVDPSGKAERELAAQYRQKAENLENAGYSRLAVTLKDLSEYYELEATGGKEEE